MALLSAFALGSAASAQPPAEPPGLVVVEVEAGAALDVGVEVGDSLNGLRAPGATATTIDLESPLQLEAFESEWGPLGGAGLVAADGELLVLGAKPWRFRTRPALPSRLEGLYETARQQAQERSDELGSSIAQLRTSLSEAKQLNEQQRAWLWREVGRFEVERAARGDAGAALLEALRVLRAIEQPWVEGALVQVLLDQASLATSETDWVAAVEALEQAERLAGPESLRAAAVLRARALMHRSRGELDVATESAGRALELYRRLAPDSYAVAESLLDLSHLASMRNDAEQALELSSAAATLLSEVEDPKSLARALNLQGRGEMLAGRLESARSLLEQSLALVEEHAANTTEHVRVLTDLARIAWMHGEMHVAQQQMQRGYDIAARIVPNELGTAMLVNNLGVIANSRGQLSEAERRWREAAERYATAAPEHPDRAIVLLNLSTAIQSSGDFVEAENLLLESLELQRQVAPRSDIVATALNNLGGIRRELGDLDGAERFYRESLDIAREADDGELSEARALVNLAQIAKRREAYEDAERLLQRSLEIRQRIAPDSIDVAITLANQGSLAQDRGDLERAKHLQRRALALREQWAPSSLQVSIGLHALGQIALQEGEYVEAEERFREALAIRRRLTPGTLREVESWRELGRTLRAAGQSAEATDALCRAVELLDRLEPRVGTTDEDRALLRAEFEDTYRDCVDAQVSMGDDEAAFATLERSRARSFRLHLSERTLGLGTEVPADLKAALERNQIASDRLLARFTDPRRAADEEFVRETADRLDELRSERERLRARVRAAEPRFAELLSPESVGWREAAAALDPATSLLAYSVGESRTLLFVLGNGVEGASLAVRSLSVSRSDLAVKIARFRSEIAGLGNETDQLRTLAAELYEALLGPALELLSDTERLLVSADGPLHLMPFAALREGGDDGRYLVERWPLHFVVSAGAYRDIRRRAPPSSEEVLVFGDPTVGAGNQSLAMRAYLGSVDDLASLPWARQEALAIADLFPETSRVFVGDQATEARVKALATRARYLHFATHGLLSERLPMSSALLLAERAAPDSRAEQPSDNGLLEAWEVIDQLRLDARLVTLSACDSAVGRERGGEGLVSLTRAFQLAGARSVLASVWRVADQATSVLMRRTYEQIERGSPHDEALRNAQLSLLRRGQGDAHSSGDGRNSEDTEEAQTAGTVTRAVGRITSARSDWSHPFYWAGFQLYGDRSDGP